MNILHNRFHNIILFFSVLVFTPIYTERFHIESSISFGDQTRSGGSKENRYNSDFSYDNSLGNIGRAPTHTRHFSTYTAQDFQNYFTARGYTEYQILNQPNLYMFDDFVKFAKTYPYYACTIRELHVTLKNLSNLQALGYWFTGTYCSGLQERIQFLYNELKTFKSIQQREPVICSFEMLNQPSEYDILDSTCCAYVSSLSHAIEKRFGTFDPCSSTIVTTNCDSQYAAKSYNINNNSKKLLRNYKYDTSSFEECVGTTLNHTIHQESLDILDGIYNLPRNSILYDHKGALVDLTVAMAEYNHVDMTDKAMAIGDLCWTLLDYGQAVAEGAALGIYSTAHDFLTNPIEATVCVVAGRQVLAYQLCKVLYNVADIGVTAITNVDGAKEKWNTYTAPLNTIINAIRSKEITVRDAIKSGTAFFVGCKAQSKLLGGLGKFCGTIQQKSINFVKKNSLVNPQKYLATPEGLLFKATTQANKLKQSEQAATASNVKNSIDNKISKKINIKNGEAVVKQATSTGITASKGIIRNVNRDLRSTIKQYNGHIFSDEHTRDGIMALGKDKETIMDSLYNEIMSLDKKGLLQEGSNQLRVKINGIDNIEIRCCIKNGEAISVNAFISNFGRIFNNFIDTTKV